MLYISAVLFLIAIAWVACTLADIVGKCQTNNVRIVSLSAILGHMTPVTIRLSSLIVLTDVKPTDQS